MSDNQEKKQIMQVDAQIVQIFKLFIIKILMKTEEKIEIKCKDVDFQYRTAMYEKSKWSRTKK